MSQPTTCYAVFVFPIDQFEYPTEKWRACLSALNERRFQLFWACQDLIPYTPNEILAIPVSAQTPIQERTATAIVEARARLVYCLQLCERIEDEALLLATEQELAAQRSRQEIIDEGFNWPALIDDYVAREGETPGTPDSAATFVETPASEIGAMSKDKIAADVAAAVIIHIFARAVPDLIDAAAYNRDRAEIQRIASHLIGPIAYQVGIQLGEAITRTVEYTIEDSVAICESKDWEAKDGTNWRTNGVMDVIIYTLTYNVRDCITDEMVTPVLGDLMDTFAAAEAIVAEDPDDYDYRGIIGSASEKITDRLVEPVGEGIADIIAKGVREAIYGYVEID